ncbi:MAG: LysM peptidoglycan-binding domain-containing protein [Sulfitobacter sp.]
MSNDNYADPVSPRLTFDSYVIPETVQEFAAPRPPASRINGTIVAVSVIAVLTFLLGIMTTLQFMGPRQPAVATVAPVAPTPESLDQFVAASLEQDVTRQQSPDLLTTAVSAARAEPEPVPTLESAVLQGLLPSRTVGNLTEAERKKSAQEALSIVSRNKLRMLREGVLAGVYTVKTKTENGQKRIVLKTINADLTSKTMADLLRKAADEGRIEIPASLNTADGQVDMETLLFNLVQTSLAEDGTPEGAEAARELSRRAFAASSAKTRDVKGERVYVVESGDSLAYISLQFYGRPSEYDRIFEANRAVLKSPDRIQIGQRLIIPG